MSGVIGPLKWPGGKSYLARKIVALMPKHIHFVEPYFGGGGVLLARSGEGVSEVANDLNDRLTNFWECLKNDAGFATFQRMAEASPFSEALWEKCAEHLERPCDHPAVVCVACAYAFFVCCRQSLAGRMDTFTGITKTRLRRGMNNEVSAWLTCVEGLPAVHARLRRVLILCRPALEVICSQDGPETLFYADPPYCHETRATTKEYGSFEMSTSDHQELLETLAAIKGKFLLSGYDNPMYEQARQRHGWTRHDWTMPNHAAGGRTKRLMTECVWANFPAERKED